jgi:2-haloacid dehalogenase
VSGSRGSSSIRIAISLSGPYTPFFTLGQGVLQILAAIHHAPVTAADIDGLRTRMLTMPAHPDVPSGLKQLREAGFRLVTCTNSPPDPEASPLKHAGIDGWFERSFSIDRVRRLKPAPQVYHMVAEELDAPPAAICMVAAHVWDTIGAQSVGFSGALIARPGNAPLPVHGLPQPQIVASDLTTAAARRHTQQSERRACRTRQSGDRIYRGPSGWMGPRSMGRAQQ